VVQHEIRKHGQLANRHERRHFDQVRRSRPGRLARQSRRHYPASPKAHRAERGWVKFQKVVKRQRGAARQNAGL